MRELSCRQRLEDIARRYDIADVYAFGSRATEIAARVCGKTVVPEYPRSDIDIGVRPLPARYLSVRNKVRLTIELEDLLDTPRVDLVVLPEAPPFLALDIIRGELLYRADAVGQAEYELYVLRRAGDLEYYERERRRQVLGMHHL